MARTESLNADAEKFNTQSAFLLSALQKLQTSIESSQREKVTLVNNFRDLSEDCETLKEDLKGGLQNLQNESSAAAKNNETSAELIQRIECLLQETQGNHADSKTQVTETLAILEKAQQQQALYSSSAEGFAQLRDEAEGFVVETKSASEAAREQSDALQDDGPGFGDLNLEAKNGFYRLMMVLTIILSLSFIAHSVISTFANPASVAQQPVQSQFDALPAAVFPSAFAPVASTNP